ncbi:PKD domain-containing protein [Halobacterium sp. CBA1126]|uniref:PKD domain-containing protein n=1 Tax=Halobacterium sp. CBA1126 TaxID=2668074 RepID=UPI0012FB9846|nr:PKD domain-containing protein [Halobacterium sp. CBA1126]MUV59624.1 PKD domain-containing protein [Halobacterium sp. CBA1126]
MGAFTSTAAERSVSVAVANDDAAFLALEPSEGPNGVYATQSGGMLELQFDGSSTAADGLNPDATTYAADVFTVTNQGTQEVSVTVAAPAEGISFYASEGGSEQRLGGDAGGVQVGVGEQVNVSVELDTTNESAIEAVDSITIAANATTTGGPTEPSDGAGGGTVEMNVSGDVVRASGAAFPGQSIPLDLGKLPDAQQDDISVTSAAINYTAGTTVDTTVSVVDAGMGESPPTSTPLPEDTSALTYLNVSHPETPAAAIGEASFQFTLPAGDASSGSVDLLRYDATNATWETTSTRISFVENTSDGDVYEARTDSLSLFAVVEAVRGQIVQTNGTASVVDASLITDPNSTYPVFAYETYRTQSLNASFWEQDATADADDAASVIREKLRINLKQAAKDTAISKFVSYVDGVLKTTLGLSGIGTLLTAIDVTLSSAEFASSLGPAIQKQAVAVHVDPGTPSYHDLRGNLEALEENSAAYENADTEREQDALLEERASLLRDTYQLLPTYLNDVHEDVVEDTAGGEDPRAYKQIRSNVESLRLLLKADYEETTRERYDAPRRSLAQGTSMPTHGWVAFGSAEVYDTMDHPDDYVVLRLNASAAAATETDVSISVTGADADALDATLVSERPDTPRAANGRTLTVDGLSEVDTVIENPAATSYLVIEPGSTTGPVRVVADAGSTPVSLSVAERAGPDIQRPHADLVTSPDPVRLRDGDVVYASEGGDTDLVWSLWDDKTPTDELDYRLRVAGGSGFSDWTAWRSTPADGRVTPNLTYDEGLTRVQLQVRDGVGRTTTRNADVVVTAGPPQTTLAAPSAGDPETGKVFVRVLPDRRVERIDVQYRVNESAPWRNLRTVTDTAGFESVTPPPVGTVDVRARAVSLANETGDWARESLTYDPSGPADTTPPDVELASAPAVVPTRIDGAVVERRVVSAESATVSWSATDGGTPDSELAYRVRVGDGSWSAWNDSGGGLVSVEPTISADGTTVRVEVRDSAGNVASRSVTLFRDTDRPTVDVAVTADVTGAVVNPSADEPVSSVELQYRAVDEESWTDWRALGSTTPTDVHLGAAGKFELRARGVDTAGNVGPWTEPVAFRSLPAERSTPISDGSERLSDGGEIEYDVPNASEVGEGAARGYLMYNALVDQIDGELLLDVYMVARDGSEVQVDEIALTEEGNQTVAADLPANFTTADKLRVEARGDGSVVLASLRAIGAEPDVPPLTAAPANATVGADVVLATDGGEQNDSYVDSYEWDIDGDGSYERITDEPTTTVVYNQSLTVNTTLRVTDIFGASVMRSARVRVNAPPSATVDGATTVRTGVDASFDATGSSDTDGTVTAYRWDIDEDGDVERNGATTSVAFEDDGVYEVAVTVVDDDGATDTTTTNVTVRNRPPEAAAGINESEPLVEAPVTFDATDSGDTDGTVTTVEWDVDADGVFEREGATIRRAFSDPGTRTVTARVTDDDGATNETTVTVDVNAPPTASVAVPSSVYTQETLAVDGTDSSDPDGEVIDYDWSIEGASAAGPNGSVSFSDDGVYEVSLTVTDDAGATDTATANVTVLNRPPVSVGIVETATPVVGELVAFNAAGSFDRDGVVDSYEWDVDGDGEVEANSATASTIYDTYGTQTATVTAVDDDGAGNETAVTFYVNAPPQPVVNATDPAYTGEPISLAGTASTDPDGTITTYRWDIDADGSVEQTNSTTAVSFTDDGTYPVKLTVVDDNGTARATTTNVTVLNRPPAASATANESNPTVGTPVAFEATGSRDPDGTIASYQWDVDADGTFEREGATIRRAFNESGLRTVTARVTDDDGATNETTVTVDVNAPPIAVINGTEPVYTGERVPVDATPSADPDGAIERYEWDVDGDGGAEQTGVNGSVSFEDDGVYELALTVVDDDGAADTTTANVTVRNRPPEAAAGVNESDPLIGAPVALDAADSLDPDGDVATFEWDLDNDSDYDRSGEAVVASFDRAAERMIPVRVTDDDGATDTTTVTVDVNAPPTPVLSLPESVRTNDAVVLNGTASTDPDGEIVDYEWLVDGSANRAGDRTNISFSDDGVYEVTLAVTDNDGATAATTQNITVRNREPKLWLTRLSPDQLPVEQNTTVEYATDTLDDDGRVVNTTITFTSPSNETRTLNESGALRVEDLGEWRVSVTATDDDGAKTTVNRTFDVNAPPHARIDAPRTATVGEPVQFYAEATDDGSIRNYTWVFGSTTVGGENATWTPEAVGEQNVTLAVTDDDGATTTVTRTLAVHDPRDVEILGPATATTGEPVTYRADTIGFGGDVRSYAWTVGGDTYAGENVTWTPEAVGEQNVTVRATGPDGTAVSANRTVVIASAYEPGLYVDTVLGGRVLSASTYPDYDYELEAEDLTYEWDLDGDGDFEREGRSSRDRFVDEPGTHEIGVRVNAPNISAATERVTVTVDEIEPNITFDWWRNDTGGTVTVTDDTVLVGAGEQDSAGDRATIQGLDRGSLALAWETSLSFPPYETVHRDDALYAIGEGIARVNVDTGEVRWTLSAIEHPEVTVAEDTVYASSDRTVIALNATTGATRWTKTADDDVYGTVADDDVVVTDSQSSVVARDADTGAVRWNVTRADAPGVEGVLDGRVLLVEDGNVTARDATTGDVVWAQPLPATETYEIEVSVAGGVVYAVSNGPSAKSLTAIAADGERLWRTQRAVETRIRVHGDTVYAASNDEVTALDRSDGTVTWNRSVSLDYPTVEWVDDERVIVDGDGNLTAFDAATGAPTWSAETGYIAYSSDYTNGTLYVGTAGGVYAVPLKDA